MNPLGELSRLLQPPSVATTGTVTGLVGNRVQVRTRDGVLVVDRRAGDATRYRVGDQVHLAGGQLTRRVKVATVVEV